MVHIGGAPATLPEILDLLRPGDVVTHCFSGRPNGVLDDDGRLLPACREAQRRGILFDIGHGAGSFSFDVYRKALHGGLVPNVISTDLHMVNVNGPVVDMPTTLSKFLALGLGLDDVIQRVTAAPARWINDHLQRPIDGLGTLRVRAPADIALVEETDEAVDFVDAAGDHLEATRRLRVRHTIRSGRVWGWPYQKPPW